MSGDIFDLRITIVIPGGEVVVPVTARPTERVADLVARVLRDNRAVARPGDWELRFGDHPLDPDLTLRDVLPRGPGLISLTLTPAGSEPPDTKRRRAPGGGYGGGGGRGGFGGEAAPPAPPRAAPAPARPAPPADDVLDDEDEFDGDLGDDFDDEGAAAEQAPAGKADWRARPAEARRATVRYYTRMNPARVFPLLVTLTRQEVEEVVKRHVGQKATGPLALDAGTPVEIEPVLPGCDVYPPRVVARLGAGDQAFTFHVVPHVLGEVTGARVLLRQDHAVLAEIALDVRVAQRTAVVISGLSAVVLPAASAAMKHFGLDFTPRDGSSPYLAALNLLFGAAPLVLTAVLAAVTGVLWWFTRPKGKDVFWDVTTKPAR